MELRASVLVGTDLVALSVWPDDDEPGAGDTTRGLPLETRCVDQALAAALEQLVERHGPDAAGADTADEQERAARAVLRWLVGRAQRHQRPP